jgi:hypothetical protein
MNISWSDPIGAKAAEGAIVVMRAGAAPTETPADGSDSSVYSPNSDWDLAGSIGTSRIVFMGTGNTVNVTNLVTDTTYYVAIYGYAGTGTGETGINYLEETPLAGNGTPFSTLPDQATNLKIRNIGSTSMSLFWTKGSGDGSIVVMKQSDAVDPGPDDGTEHSANSTWDPGTDLGGGNYVVYRGTGEFVNVTSLPGPVPQTFHAAVYTYTGAGTEITYLRTSPARANASTSPLTPHNVAVLNIDETVGCTSGCHGMHGDFGVPRGTDQETLCITCHNATGMTGAKGLLDFSLHTNNKNSPTGSEGMVDCGSCHEVHNPSGDDTTFSTHPVNGGDPQPNLHYIRANADKNVPSALSSDMVLHADSASEDWAISGSSYQGMCQVCHTKTTSGYTNDGSGQETSHQGGDDNCRGCHGHGSPGQDGGFSGDGGDCTGCHASVRDEDGEGPNPGRRAVMAEFTGTDIVSAHLTGTIDAADCEVCHNHSGTGSTHKSGQVNLFNVDSGGFIEILDYIDPNDDATEADKLTVFCLACHDSDGANGDTTPFSAGAPVVNIKDNTTDPNHDWTNASHNTGGTPQVGCFGDGAFGCHGSGHGSMKLNMLAPWDAIPDPTTKTEEEEGFCFNCHDSDGPSSFDIESQILGTQDYTVTSTNTPPGQFNTRHDVLWGDQDTFGGVIECTICHLQHKDNGSDTNVGIVSNPDDGTKLNDYVPSNYQHELTGKPTPPQEVWDSTNPIGCTTCPRVEPDYIQFCLACHDGTYPGMKTGVLNMAVAYETDQHGKNWGSGEGKGTLKPPWVQTIGDDYSGGYTALNCNICHGPHGSDNMYNLRTSITVAGSQMSVGSILGNSGFSSFSGTTHIIGQQENFTPADHNWGAWCTFCHELSGHNYNSETVGCTDAHKHGAANF